VLNQAVLLRGINDRAQDLVELSEALFRRRRAALLPATHSIRWPARPTSTCRPRRRNACWRRSRAACRASSSPAWCARNPGAGQDDAATCVTLGPQAVCYSPGAFLYSRRPATVRRGGNGLGRVRCDPLVVLSRQQDPVEIINSTLRNAGYPCTARGSATWRASATSWRGRPPPDVPVRHRRGRDHGGPRRAQAVRHAGAGGPGARVRSPRPTSPWPWNSAPQDVVTLQARPRLQAVAGRELHAARLDHALAGTLASARQYRDQMKAFMTGSTDANRARPGRHRGGRQPGVGRAVRPRGGGGHARPAADGLLPATQPRGTQGALVAGGPGSLGRPLLQAVALMPGAPNCRWKSSSSASSSKASPPCGLRVATQQRDVETLTRQLEEALRYDTATGLLKRAAFFEQAGAQTAQTLKAGLRSSCTSSPIGSRRSKANSGRFAIEDLLEGIGPAAAVAAAARRRRGPHHAARFAVIAERGQRSRSRRLVDARPAEDVRSRVPDRRAVRIDHLQRRCHGCWRHTAR